MNEIVKDFWSTLSILVLVFFGIWILGVFVKPVIIALVFSVLFVVWKYKPLWAGIKYYWNLLWSWIIKKN
jgi:hypothetical protein